MKFTFKRQPRETGLGGVAHPHPAVDIKAGGRKCGWLQPPYWNGHRDWEVWFAIEKDAHHDDGNPNCAWMNIKLAGGFNTEAAARQWVKDHEAELSAIRLHFHDAPAKDGGKR